MNKPTSSIVAELVSQLSPELREDYEERAAIMEFEGEIGRDHAEALALLDVLKRHPEALSQVRAFHITRHGESRFLLSTTQHMSTERLITLGYAVTVIPDIAALLSQHFYGIAVLKTANDPVKPEKDKD